MATEENLNRQLSELTSIVNAVASDLDGVAHSVIHGGAPERQGTHNKINGLVIRLRDAARDAAAAGPLTSPAPQKPSGRSGGGAPSAV